ISGDGWEIVVVCVIREHVDEVVGGIFIHAGAVVIRDGSVVHIRDGDADSRDVAEGNAVGGSIGETVGAVIVGAGGVGKGAVAVQDERAVRGAADRGAAGDGERIAIRIGIVGENAKRRDHQWRVFGNGVGVVIGDGRIIAEAEGDGGNVRKRAEDILRLVSKA